MSLLLTLIILVIVFCLLWYLIGIIPFPASPHPLANIRWLLYCILIITACIVLLGYIPGWHLRLPK